MYDSGRISRCKFTSPLREENPLSWFLSLL
jgi:hypothetical protein